MPLPHGIWSKLPGRQLVSEIDQVAGLGAMWRPITLTPANGWQALASLLPALAVFLVGIQLAREDLYRLLAVMIGLGLLSAVFGLLQVVGGYDGPLYLYDITSNGYAVGLFANRNHAATQFACIFPMLAVFATTLDNESHLSRTRSKAIVAALVAAILVPLVLITGSRTGAVLALLGLASTILLYKGQRSRDQGGKHGKSPRIGLGVGLSIFALLALIVLSVVFARAASINRFMTQSNVDDVRFEYWQIAVEMFWKYFPLGSGVGSFAEAFQIDEPARLLANTYLNRAHNDWLETAVTFGIPGLAILLFAVLAYLKRARIAWFSNGRLSRSILYARMASISIGLIGLASVTDYPLRTPALLCFLVVLVLWLNLPSAPRTSMQESGDMGEVDGLSDRSIASRHSRPGRRLSTQVNKLRLLAICAGVLVIGWMTFALAVSGIARNKAPSTALKFVPFEASALASRADELFFSNPTRPPEASFRLATKALEGQAINAKALRLLGYRADLRGDQSRAAALMQMSQRLSRRDAGAQLWLIEASARSGDILKTLEHYDTALTTKPETSALLFPRLLAALEDPDVRDGLALRLRRPKDWTTNFLEFSIASASDLTPIVRLIDQIGGVPTSPAQQKQQLLLLDRLVAANRFDDARTILRTMTKTADSQNTVAGFRKSDLSGRLGVMGWQLQDDPNGGASFWEAANGKAIELNVFANSATTKGVAGRLLYLEPGQYVFQARTISFERGNGGFLRWQMRCPAAGGQVVWTIDSIDTSSRATFSIPANCAVQFLDLIASGGRGQTGLEATIASVSISPID
ncbi:MAG: O-antigen ligase family protein [Sphingorhabdus sp.]